MKNIHILPTDKPSRMEGLLFFGNDLISPIGHPTMFLYRHIYITSNEEIKDVDWYLTFTNNLAYEVMGQPRKCEDTNWNFSHCKKIILSTDQDLIADGVQAIDDEFLEWFIKNPSCEHIPIITTTVMDESLYKTNIGFESWRKEKPKRETREEAAERLFPIILEDDGWDKNKQYRDEWIAGAKWQAEKMDLVMNLRK